MILGYEPGYIVSIFIVTSALILFTINLVKYNWKNGELKTRIALQVWGWFKLLHIVSTYNGYKHYLFLTISLMAILYIVIQNFAFKKPNDSRVHPTETK